MQGGNELCEAKGMAGYRPQRKWRYWAP